jgi:hypothetical protein
LHLAKAPEMELLDPQRKQAFVFGDFLTRKMSACHDFCNQASGTLSNELTIQDQEPCDEVTNPVDVNVCSLFRGKWSKRCGRTSARPGVSTIGC